MRLLSLLRHRGEGSGGSSRHGTHPRRPDEERQARQREQEEQLQRIRARVAADAPGGMTHDDGVRMDAFIDALGLPTFPATREELIERARRRGAREAVLVDLRSLAEVGRYGSMEQLLADLGIGRAGRVDVPGAGPDVPGTVPPDAEPG
jgi:hypothetical protein